MLQYIYTTEELDNLIHILRISKVNLAKTCATSRQQINRVFNMEYEDERVIFRWRKFLTYVVNDFICEHYGFDPSCRDISDIITRLTHVDIKDRKRFATETFSLTNT